MVYAAVDTDNSTIQHFNGGIMFFSYVISVIGAQTTLELLSRRTHIKGVYNWFLLCSAAFIMGGVSIWSMHFIGNNSLYLIVGGIRYQLTYRASYTFGSLAVSIACMFIAFIFVGITEEAKVIRIIPSGVFAGLGAVCMHYMGQFAIKHFKIVYSPGYIVGAAIIACFAITAALFIFFKLRERWMNQWYKRLGCSMIMGLAICGMHYTGLTGTEFLLPEGEKQNMIPSPKLKTATLIGIISGIVVLCCIVLLYISVKAGIKILPVFTKSSNKRLILDAVIFDPIGRLLVKIDGTLPMTEIVSNLELRESNQEFSVQHPLFIRLFEKTIEKSSARLGIFDKRPSGLSGNSSLEAYEIIENQFFESCNELKDELRLSSFSDLGILSDIVVTTDTIAKAQMFSGKKKPRSRFQYKKTAVKELPLTDIELTFQEIQQQNHNSEEDDNISSSEYKKKTQKKWRRTKGHTEDEETAIESISSVHKRSSGATTAIRSSSEDTNDDNRSSRDRLSVEDSDGEDKHIFIVKKLVDQNSVDRLLSRGYRFAETVFISKTMAAKLKIPTDHMRHHFNDMQQMADSVCVLTQNDWMPSLIEPAPNPTIFKASTKSCVYMGAFVLIDETKELTSTQLIVEKAKRFSFPLVQVKDELEGLEQLDTRQLEYLSVHQGCSLFDMAKIDQKTDSSLIGIKRAAQQLIDMTSYSKALYQSTEMYRTVLDLPPFSVTTGPCQLILFTSFVHTKGAIAAINHTLSESIKCIPLQLYRPIAGYITDQAAYIYQMSNQTRSLPTYFLQQQVYRQQTSFDLRSQKQPELSEDPKPSSSSSSTLIPMEDMSKEKISFTENVVTSSDELPVVTTNLNDPFSLPPPPRAKRNRIRMTNALLNSSNSPFDLLSPLQAGASRLGNNGRQLQSLQPAPLTILTTQDRFWWINSIVDETIHNATN